MNNKNSKMLGIILVPLVFGILILVASAFTKEPKKAEDFYYEENSKNVMGANKSYEDRGYVKANDFPQALQNLVASGILTAEETTEEDTPQEQQPDETGRMPQETAKRWLWLLPVGIFLLLLAALAIRYALSRKKRERRLNAAEPRQAITWTAYELARLWPAMGERGDRAGERGVCRGHPGTGGAERRGALQQPGHDAGAGGAGT